MSADKEEAGPPKTEYGEAATRLLVHASRSIRLEAVSADRPKRRSSFRFIRNLFIRRSERALLAGCRKLMADDYEEASRHFRKAAPLPEAAFALGFLAIKDDRIEEAEEHLLAAMEFAEDSGGFLDRHGLSLVVSIPTGPHSSLDLEPNLRGALLGLIDIYTKQDREPEAALLRLKLRQESMPDAHGQPTELGG